MTSVTTTAETTAMPRRTRPSMSRKIALRAGLLVQRHAEVDELLAFRTEVRHGLAVNLLRDLSKLGQRPLRHGIHLHACGRELREQLVVVLLALRPLPRRHLPGCRHDGALHIPR